MPGRGRKGRPKPAPGRDSGGCVVPPLAGLRIVELHLPEWAGGVGS
jgi:hypothetical protein